MILALALLQAQPIAVPAKPEPAPAGMQWLYGSGEGAAASIQTYRAFTNHVLAARRFRPRDSVVLAAGSSLGAPRFVPCGRKPVAVMLDIDETAIQNIGYEYGLAQRGRSSDGKLLDQWQRDAQRAAAAMPGAVEALGRLRAAGVTVVFNSGRENKDSAAAAQTLAWAGLGPAVPGKTLLLRGDIDGKAGKDGRRSFVAQHYCVVAMAGDQLGDFADGLNEKGLAVGERRRLASSGRFGALWGRGWFLLSNPVYGPAMRGSIDDIFAPGMRWGDEQ